MTERYITTYIITNQTLKNNSRHYTIVPNYSYKFQKLSLALSTLEELVTDLPYSTFVLEQRQEINPKWQLENKIFGLKLKLEEAEKQLKEL